jgi:carbonic anhydrase
MAALWSFERSGEWIKKYNTCNNKAERISPLNIDESEVSPCNTLCKLSIKYEPTTCSISMVNNIPTVTFSPNCLIKFRDNFYFLRKMTLHYTSMHTINDSYTDLEILLYHNTNPINDNDGGVILSILLTKGGDYGPANEFFNEFINQMPSNEMPIEQDIDVSNNWSPEQLLPSSKAFFYYDGALPYPPCTPKWTYIIFEELVPISMNIIDTIKAILGMGNKNIRPIQKTPKNISIFYNSNSQFDGTQDMSDTAINTAVTPVATVPALDTTTSATSWLKQNLYFIKGIVIGLILLIMIYVAIKFAKIIVSHDLLNSFIISQLKKKQKNEYEKSQQQMAAQQAAEYGGVAPVEAPINNNKNNNNNNNNN